MIDKIYILFKFEDHVRQLIHLYKYNRYLSLAKYFADEIIKTFPLLIKNSYHYIIPVPLHHARLRERGYNQSYLFAEHLSACLQIPILDHALIRTRNTPSQTKLSEDQRRKNVLHAFKCRHSLKGKSILLVDDIITTGNTLNECTNVLKSAGVIGVDLLTIAGLEKTIFY
jgi:ComF family protein